MALKTFTTADGSANQALVTNGSGVLSFVTPSGGKVQQVVNMTTNSDTTTTSTTFVTTVLTLAITPSSASSKILILATSFLNANGPNEFAYATIARGGTNLGAANGMVGVYSDSDIHAPCTINYLDSPNSTSSLTYDVRIRTSNAGVPAKLNQQTGTSSLILMEIAG